jgi:hypothetical protein
MKFMPFAGISTSVLFVLGLAACSMPAVIPTAEVSPDQYQDMNCELLKAEKTRLLAQRADLRTPLLSSQSEAEREGELTHVNGRLYAIVKVQSDKNCPLVASAWSSSVVR